MMDRFLDFLIVEIGSRPVLVGIIGALILLWLYFDIKRQRKWRAEKEAKIAERKARIAVKKK